MQCPVAHSGGVVSEDSHSRETSQSRIDFTEPHQTAVYYVNDSDGDTVVFKETVDDVPPGRAARFANDNKFRIEACSSPVKGKMIAFDGRHYHASMHPMKASKRIAITFNFV